MIDWWEALLLILLLESKGRLLEVIGGYWRLLEVIGGYWRLLEVIGGYFLSHTLTLVASNNNL